uniref:Survival Motor Neuron Gemin2-binding domain-containing protein n=1 Tax=Amphiprion ocellaris TaxID=80972 RepID=A0AAQ6AG94_AMPOC
MANGCKDVLFTRGTGQSDDSDIWDDTALIKAYDKATICCDSLCFSFNLSLISPSATDWYTIGVRRNVSAGRLFQHLLDCTMPHYKLQRVLFTAALFLFPHFRHASSYLCAITDTSSVQ